MNLRQQLTVFGGYSFGKLFFLHRVECLHNTGPSGILVVVLPLADGFNQAASMRPRPRAIVGLYLIKLSLWYAKKNSKDVPEIFDFTQFHDDVA